MLYAQSLYLCDNKFHTDALSELLESDSKFGFIIMDGNGVLYGTLAGNTREVIHKFSVDLPKKHGRGGQSALRFARLRMEARHNYVRKVAEHAVQHFIRDDKVNVQGIVLAGSADFKTELNGSDMFDMRLAAKVIKVVDVSYGGENGFNQAIELAAESLTNVKFVQEKKCVPLPSPSLAMFNPHSRRLIQKYFDEISLDTGKYCFGVEDTLRGLELGAVETLIVWENLDITRHVLRDSTGADIVIHTAAPPPTASNTKIDGLTGINALSEKDRAKFIDKITGLEMEQAQEPQGLLEWLSDKYKEFGTDLEFVSNRCVSSAFCRRVAKADVSTCVGRRRDLSSSRDLVASVASFATRSTSSRSQRRSRERCVFLSSPSPSTLISYPPRTGRGRVHVRR